MTSDHERELARSYYPVAVAKLYDLMSSDDPGVAAEARQQIHLRADTILNVIEDLDDGWLETEATEGEIEKVMKVADMIKQHRAKVGV